MLIHVGVLYKLTSHIICYIHSFTRAQRAALCPLIDKLTNPFGNPSGSLSSEFHISKLCTTNSNPTSLVSNTSPSNGLRKKTAGRAGERRMGIKSLGIVDGSFSSTDIRPVCVFVWVSEWVSVCVWEGECVYTHIYIHICIESSLEVARLLISGLYSWYQAYTDR